MTPYEAITLENSPKMREFASGATRDNDETKIDYEGFLSPYVLWRYGMYMTEHRVQADGRLRDSDNWQKGIPLSAYIKSCWRHFMTWFMWHRGHVPVDVETCEDALCAIIFNASGYLHEILCERLEAKEIAK